MKFNFISEQLLGPVGTFEEEIEKRMICLSRLSGSSGYGCSECSHTSRDKYAMSVHIEAKHVTQVTLSCQFCDRICPTRESLRKHISRNHPK